MKKLLLGLSALVSLSSTTVYANSEFQNKNITGDWDSGKNNPIFRITKKKDGSLKVLKCNRSKWIESNYIRCSYSKALSYEYNYSFDGYCIDSNYFCRSGLKVSDKSYLILMEIIDPLDLHNTSNQGKSSEAYKTKLAKEQLPSRRRGYSKKLAK